MSKTTKDFIGDFVNATINGDEAAQELAIKNVLVPKTAEKLGINTGSPEGDIPQPEPQPEQTELESDSE
jgi:hypothetical protein